MYGNYLKDVRLFKNSSLSNYFIGLMTRKKLHEELIFATKAFEKVSILH